MEYNCCCLSSLKHLTGTPLNSISRNKIEKGKLPPVMTSCCLFSNSNTRQKKDIFPAYPDFSSSCSEAQIFSSLERIANLIKEKKGLYWKALCPFAIAAPMPSIRKKAAYLIGTLAPSGNNITRPFTGFNFLVDVLCDSSFRPGLSKSPLFDALLETADLRLLPLALEIIDKLSDIQISGILKQSTLIPNALACEWLLNALNTYPSLAKDITLVFVHASRRTNTIIDAITPIPAWKFKNPAQQPLHGWSLPEYFERIKRRLSQSLSSVQIDSIRQAWLNPS